MDEKLIEKYKEYANSVEAFAVFFVKKYLHASKGKWVLIRAYEKKSVNRNLDVDLTPFNFLFTEKIPQARLIF